MNNDNWMMIRTLARKTRSWVEVEDNRRNHQSEGLNGWCAIASAQLSRELALAGIRHEICMAESGMGSHVFLLVDDHVVDITATQFSEFSREPLVIKHHKEAEVYWFYTIDQLFTSAKELRKYQRQAGWPGRQIAYSR